MKIKKYLLIGLIGAIITVVGEMLGGLVPSPDTTDQMTRFFSSVELLPVWRIGLCSTIGGLGILMQFFGFHALYLTFDNKESRIVKLFYAGNCGFTIIGAMIHILMSMFMYVYKVNAGVENFENIIIEFSIWFLAPMTVIFYLAYAIFAFAMFSQIIKGHTLFPKWFWVFNPIIGKVVINTITAVLPSSAIMNGIGFSDMGLTSLVTFAALYENIRRK